jgi:hypothetical protein
LPECLFIGRFETCCFSNGISFLWHALIHQGQTYIFLY